MFSVLLASRVNPASILVLFLVQQLTTHYLFFADIKEQWKKAAKEGTAVEEEVTKVEEAATRERGAIQDAKPAVEETAANEEIKTEKS